MLLLLLHLLLLLLSSRCPVRLLITIILEYLSSEWEVWGKYAECELFSLQSWILKLCRLNVFLPFLTLSFCYSPVAWWWRRRSESSSVCVYSLFKWNGWRERTGSRGVLWKMWFWLRATENVVLSSAALKKHFWARSLRFFPYKAGRLRSASVGRPLWAELICRDVWNDSRLLQETWTLLLAARTLSSSDTSSVAAAWWRWWWWWWCRFQLGPAGVMQREIWAVNHRLCCSVLSFNTS